MITLRHQGNNTESIIAIDKAISLKPDNAECYLQKGITLRELGIALNIYVHISARL
ncbi:hypothetical protein [Candidatus Tisiphia endosymbiont of Oplodontha viridula]|uniref:hypothetical protein n=1 Tax=Candidatus Tisiphia endosymbiont of Oplodontha viridula TaxID=3077925 RepID=UPI0035C8B33A